MKFPETNSIHNLFYRKMLPARIQQQKCKILLIFLTMFLWQPVTITAGIERVQATCDMEVRNCSTSKCRYMSSVYFNRSSSLAALVISLSSQYKLLNSSQNVRGHPYRTSAMRGEGGVKTI